MRLNFFIIFSIIISTTFSQEKFSKGLNSINSQSLLEIVTYLSSPELEGRMSGSDAYNVSAEFAKNVFKSSGLKPPSKDYYQNFNVEFNEIQKASLKVNGLKCEIGKDFICRAFSGAGSVNSEVVFCGYGISKPQWGYDDYENINVKNKIVLIFKQNPSWNIDDYKWDEAYCRHKANVAYNHGAVAVLFVSKPNDKEVQDIIGSVMESKEVQNEKFPQLHINQNVCKELLRLNNLEIELLQADIDKYRKPNSIALNSSAEIDINTKYFPQVKTSNIIGILEGSDSILKNEYLIFAAHLDHVGKQPGNIYFPGANDNASGSALIIELAKAFHKNEIKPKRSIVFILFSAEEMGMLGSKYYCENPLVPLHKTKAMFNFDCIAHGDSILLRGGKLFPVIWNKIKNLDDKYFNLMTNVTTNTCVADAEAFYKKGIPALYFVTTNTYKHLHKISDTPETLNPLLFEKISKLAFLTAWTLADE